MMRLEYLRKLVDRLVHYIVILYILDGQGRGTQRVISVNTCSKGKWPRPFELRLLFRGTLRFWTFF